MNAIRVTSNTSIDHQMTKNN